MEIFESHNELMEIQSIKKSNESFHTQKSSYEYDISEILCIVVIVLRSTHIALNAAMIFGI